MRDLLVALPPGVRPRLALEQELRAAIRDGRLGAGSALPSSRALATDLGIARSTVVAAYEQLAVEGYVHAQQGRSTIVASRATATEPVEDRNPLGSHFAHDFRPGEPSTGSFPRKEWQRSVRRIMAQAPDDVFGYGDPRGRSELREALASYLARVRMVNVQAPSVRVYAGFASSLGFIGEMLRRRGVTRVAVEHPMMFFHRQILELVGLETVSVPVDVEGLGVEQLGEHDVGAVLVTPANQQPLGVTMSSERRNSLLAWAHRVDAWIVEDDYDGEFRYDRHPIGALQGLDAERVIYAGTASKALGPGLHLSWLVVPRGLRRDLDAVTHLRAGASTVNQVALADLIVRGAYDRHVRNQRRTYQRRRNVLLERFAEISWLDMAPSNAGLHLVGRIRSDVVDERTLIATASESAVALTGLQTHFSYHEPGLVIGVSRPANHHFAAAVDHLLASLHEPNC